MAISTSTSSTVKKDRAFLQRKKDTGEPISMLTCYDYPTAVLQEQAGIDIIFVGDSVGTNVLGYQTETEVTMDDMVHHLRAVRRGVQNAYLLVDLPHLSFDTPETALANARILLEHGADGVKLEGGLAQAPVTQALTSAGIEVCAHIGFTPQTLGSKGKVQGKDFEGAATLVQSALAFEQAGAFLVLLELVTEDLTQLITDRLRVPTIGIGSGRYCDGQVLVVNDLLGYSPFSRKIAKRYMEGGELALQAFRAYREEVNERRFPSEANGFPTAPETMAQLEQWLQDMEQ